MNTTSIKPRTVVIAQAMFFINAAIWLAFGVAGIIRLARENTAPENVMWVITILMFGNVGAMLVAGLWLHRQSKWAYIFALAVLVVNIFLTFTDQVGFFDILTALIDVSLIGLLLFDRKNYFKLLTNERTSHRNA
jgi:uncharacterized membrane protein YsdA (DUF1294 family)